jgi:hypothetical protein
MRLPAQVPVERQQDRAQAIRKLDRIKDTH